MILSFSEFISEDLSTIHSFTKRTITSWLWLRHVSGTGPRAMHVFSLLIPPQPCRVSASIIPIFQRRKLRPSELKSLGKIIKQLCGRIRIKNQVVWLYSHNTIPSPNNKSLHFLRVCCILRALCTLFHLIEQFYQVGIIISVLQGGYVPATEWQAEVSSLGCQSLCSSSLFKTIYVPGKDEDNQQSL